MKKKCVICFDGNQCYYFKDFGQNKLMGKHPVWCPDIESAMVFESKALAKDYLSGYWFDSCRKHCEVKAI